MKKLIIRSAIAVLILIILAVIMVGIFLDAALKRGIETIGPMVTKVEIKLDSVNLSLLSGGGTVKGLLVGNPEGFKAPSAIQVGKASPSIKPGSVLSDKIVIKSINVQAPEITFETDLKANNLSKILANVQAFTGTADAGSSKPGGSPAPAATKGEKKLQVDDFLIAGGKINVSLTVLGGKSVTVPLPDIHLTDLGQGPEGITPAELIQRVLKEIEKGAVQASSGAVVDLGKQAANLGKGIGNAAGDAAKSVTDGIGGLFKKK